MSDGSASAASAPDSCAALQESIRSTPEARRGRGAAACVVTPQAVPKDSGVTTQAVAPLSATCNSAIGNTSYWITRNDACRIIRSGLNLVNTQNGQIIGSTVFDMYFFAFTANNINTWQHQVEIQGISQTPNMAGTTVRAVSRCSGPCVNPSTRFPSQSVSPGREAEGETLFDGAASTAGSVSSARTQFGFIFSNYGGVPNPTTTYYTEYNPYTPIVRCDRATPGRGVGCVFSEYIPAIIYSRSGDVAELARHIGDAQNSGLPGAFPNGAPLTRLLAGDDSRDNRTRACPDSYSRPAGKSCDEYPFATSNQGANTAGGAGRTFSYCSIPQLPTGITGATGYSACMINGTQNSLGGTRLSTFYGDNRVIANERYRVWIVG